MFGAWLGHWANLQTARSDRQREFLQGSFRPFVIATLIYVIPLIGLRIMRAMDVAVLSSVLVEALSIWTMLYIAFLIRRSLDVQRRSREILKEDEEAGRTREPTTSFHRFFSRWEGREWVSPAKLFGVPLVHLRFEAQPMQATSMAPWTAAFATPAAHGWIALGGRAHGILFGMGGVASGMIAMGGVAVGGIAFGGLSCGLLSLGGMAIGAAALGGMSLGGWVWGGLAAGWQSFGGMALGWKSAYGGLAISNEYAVGGKAIAAHANDAVAKAVIEEDSFYVLASKLAEWVATPYAFLVIFGISLLPTVVLALVGYRRKAPKIDLESQSGGGDAGCG
jgi:hypothetical protein